MSSKKEGFQQRLKAARIKKGLSQAELSEKVDAYVSNISRYERGEHFPSTEMLGKLAAALDVSTDYLMHGSSTDIVMHIGLDKELVSRFKEVQVMNKEDKKVILALFDAFIAKNKLKSILK